MVSLSSRYLRDSVYLMSKVTLENMGSLMEAKLATGKPRSFWDVGSLIETLQAIKDQHPHGEMLAVKRRRSDPDNVERVCRPRRIRVAL